MRLTRSLAHSLTRGRTGQFIPMAAMVMLSVVVFMVGIVNVYMVSRAKLRAQNLADAAAMYVAGRMVQSLNNAADKNEWLNHIYGDPNDPSYTTAGHDPCVPPGDPKKVPPGLGCFAANRATPFVFSNVQTATEYAKTVNIVNQTQMQFQNVFNSLLGAQDGVATNSNSNALQTNLYNAIPDLQHPDVYAIVFNSTQGENMANANINVLSQAPSSSPNTPAAHGVVAEPLQPITYTTQDVTVPYTEISPTHPLGHTVYKTLTALMSDMNGQNTPTGYMAIDPNSPLMSAWGSGQIGAGSIVRVTVSLIGLGSKTVQARSMVYVVIASGGLRPDAEGLFKPTYFIKLGKPL